MLPAEVKPGEVRLDVRLARDVGQRIEDEAGRRPSIRFREGRQAGEVEQGRCYVSRGDRVARPPLVAPGGAHDERHVHRRVVDEEGMRLLRMVAEALAVIGGEHDDRAIHQSFAGQETAQAADDGVGVGNLANVSAPLIARLEGLGRIVGGMGIVEVNPREERLVLLLVQPGQGIGHHLVAGFLNGAEGECLVLRQVEGVRIRFKPLTDAPLGGENPGRDESSGFVARFLESLGEGFFLWSEEVATVVAHSVSAGQSARHQGGVGRQREGHRGGHALEDQALVREGVDVRRFDLAESVGGKAIRAQRVEGDEDDVHPFACRPRPLPQTAGSGRVRGRGAAAPHECSEEQAHRGQPHQSFRAAARASRVRVFSRAFVLIKGHVFEA
jgi:hypothetical protein